jgi:Na+-transporting methylmalonyl-CoA/oxaloacetate decarboxylase beta subunit
MGNVENLYFRRNLFCMKKVKILKIVAIISGFLAILQFLYPLGLKFILKWIFNYDIKNPHTASSIGIIGGGDGPAAVFVAYNLNIILLVIKYSFAVICAMISILSIIAIKKRK